MQNNINFEKYKKYIDPLMPTKSPAFNLCELFINFSLKDFSIGNGLFRPSIVQYVFQKITIRL